MPVTLPNIILEGDNIPVLEGLRQKAKKCFEDKGLPTSKNESWKYTKIRDLNFEEYVFCEHKEHNCSCHNKTIFFEFSSYDIMFCNGQLCNKHFHLPNEIEIMSLLEAVKDKEAFAYLNKSFDMKNFPFAILNSAYLEQGVFIRVAKNYIADKPLALIYHTKADEKYMGHIHNVVVMESGAKIDLIEYYHYTGDIKSEYFNNIVNEFFISNGAKLNHYKLQNEAFKSTHIALNVANVKSKAKYESFCLQRGANLARNETIVNLLEEDADTVVNGAYIINGWANVDTTTQIRHMHEKTSSSQLIKGVVGGCAKGVFQGKIHIAPDAVKTNGYQLHKALLLSDEAVVNVKPELEIFADDVKCSHGSTCGEIDKEQMFYMRSRGISEDNAKQILINAFISELLDNIENTDIKCWMKNFSLF